MTAPRAAVIAGYRALADTLETNPDMPLPHLISHPWAPAGSMTIYTHNQRDFRAATDAMPWGSVKYRSERETRARLDGLDVEVKWL